MTFALHFALRSDVGLLREGNEDSAYAGPKLLAIADGMGGHAAGEVASAVAISAIAPLDDENLTSSEDMLDALAEAVASARDTLHDMSMSDPAVEGMGTTLTALLWSGAQVAVCHIGDSRAYLLRDGDLYQITRDHTLIQSLVDEGRLSPAAAANHPQRSLIIRALQGSTDADPDLAMHEAFLDDRYLLCSDGLTDVVADEAVHKVLSTVADADKAVSALIALAIRNGGPDNITCIVADVVDTATGPVAPTWDTVLAGAIANGDVDSLLQAATGRAAGAANAGSANGGNGGPANSGAANSGAASSGAANGGGANSGATNAASRAANGGLTVASRVQRVNGHGGIATLEADEGDDDHDAEFDAPRRRWPVVTSILVVLVLLIIAGLYVGYRSIQDNYYLAADGQQLTIYRGINDKIGFISLSSVYQKTNVPASHVPADLSLPTDPTTLAKTRGTLTSIQHAYTCKLAEDALATWQATYAGKSTSKPAKSGKHKTAPPAKIPPKPAVPLYCSQAAG
jgi:PPM family protein phosphatase